MRRCQENSGKLGSEVGLETIIGKKIPRLCQKEGTPGGNEAAHGCAGGVSGNMRQLARREKRAVARRAEMGF